MAARKLKPKVQTAFKALAHVLRGVAPYRFNMYHWVRGSKETVEECGFAGCAIGWAWYTGILQPFGLTIINGTPTITTPLGVEENEHALAYAFKIPKRDVVELFFPKSYTTDAKIDRNIPIAPSKVAARLTRYVKEHS